MVQVERKLIVKKISRIKYTAKVVNYDLNNKDKKFQSAKINNPKKLR